MNTLTSKQKSRALIEACKIGQIDNVRALLKERIDINARDGFAGWTALMWAAQKGHVKIVRLLLDKGAEATEKSWGTTALLLASRRNHTEIVQILEPYYQTKSRKNRYGGFWARFRGKDRERAREEYYSFLRGLVRRKVEDPYNVGNYCALGDVFVESAMDGRAVYHVMKSYNVDDVSSVFDPTSNVTIETVMMHGKHVALHDTFGDTISDPNKIPKLVPRSELDTIRTYLTESHQPPEYWAGHVAERVVRDRLNGLGYHVELPAHSNQQGYDLLVDRAFFEDHGLHFNEDLNTGLGKLQVKNGDSVSGIHEHIHKYVDGSDSSIPVLASDEACHNFVHQQLIPFSELGMDKEYIHHTVQAQISDIVTGHFADVAQGMDTEVFQHAIGGHDFGIVYIGPVIASSLVLRSSNKSAISSVMEVFRGQEVGEIRVEW